MVRSRSPRGLTDRPTAASYAGGASFGSPAIRILHTSSPWAPASPPLCLVQSRRPHDLSSPLSLSAPTLRRRSRRECMSLLSGKDYTSPPQMESPIFLQNQGYTKWFSSTMQGRVLNKAAVACGTDNCRAARGERRRRSSSSPFSPLFSRAPVFLGCLICQWIYLQYD